MPTEVARQAVELMRKHGLDTWVYSGNDWLITKIDAPHVAREAWTVKFEPKVVANLAEHLQQVAKIVGVSDDLDRVQRCEAASQAAFGQHATANRSQPYYLDVTNKDANKGAVVEYLSRYLGVPAQEIGTIGDQQNDDRAQHAVDEAAEPSLLIMKMGEIDTPAPSQHGNSANDQQRPDTAVDARGEHARRTALHLGRAGRSKHILDSVPGDAYRERQGHDDKKKPEARHCADHPAHQ